MSYILDALRRADAERERGAVPACTHSRSAYCRRRRTPNGPACVGTIVLLVLAPAAAAWNFFGASEPRLAGGAGGGAGARVAARPVAAASMAAPSPVDRVARPAVRRRPWRPRARHRGRRPDQGAAAKPVAKNRRRRPPASPGDRIHTLAELPDRSAANCRSSPTAAAATAATRRAGLHSSTARCSMKATPSPPAWCCSRSGRRA